MEFVCFHLMPYRPLDMAARRKERSAWVVLPMDAPEFPLASAVSFRQQHPGDWAEVIEQLAVALQIATTPEPAHA